MPEAIKLYEQSAMLNNSKAMMVLGRLYENGIGTKQDI
jgi:TPR repeat protein